MAGRFLFADSLIFEMLHKNELPFLVLNPQKQKLKN
jgi:hypothetical protein